MEPEKKPQFSEFLLGFSEAPELQPFLFGLFLSMYLVTVFGNLLKILATITDSHLHTPMYFFLSNLLFADICFIFTTIPKVLVSPQTQRKVISYGTCLTQMSLFLLFVGLEDFLPTVMAYDHFMAICHPLYYTVTMNLQLCVLLVLGSYIMTALNSLLQTSMVLQFSFCEPLEIPHFFCELKQMVQLACSDTFFNDMVMYFVSALVGVVPLTGIFLSSSKIVSSICAMPLALGKYKVFSIRVSHLSVVSLFYCTSLGMYFSSAATHDTFSSAPASVTYTAVTPMLILFIYSLRNKDIIRAMKIFWDGSYKSIICAGAEEVPVSSGFHKQILAITIL